MFRDRFLESLERLNLASQSPLLAAVSGGPDSIALLDLLATTAEKHRHPLIVAHVDHGISPDSGRIADLVEKVAAGYGLRTIVARLALGPTATETEAREARYQWLERIRGQEGAEFIVTAHHADDQVETVLLRVLNGTGPAGLAAMAPVQGRIVRPLLPFRRDQLAQYLLDHRLPVWNDPANQNPVHLRSWIRGSLLPVLRERLPDVAASLLRVASQASADRMAWDRLLDVLPGLEWRAEPGGGSVAAASLAGYDSTLGNALLRTLARRAGLTLGIERAARVLEFLNRGQSGSTLELGQGWTLELDFGRAKLLGPSVAGAEPPVIGTALEVNPVPGLAHFGRWSLSWRLEPAPETQARDGLAAWFIPGALQVRPWQAGDSIRPLKGRGSRLVVKCFQEARVARAERSTWPVLLDLAGQVIWVPGVCRSENLLPRPGAEALRVDAHLT